MERYRRDPSYYSVCDWSKKLGIRNIGWHWIWASHWHFFIDYSCLWRRRDKNKKWIFHFLWVYQECVSPIVSDKKVKLWTNGGSRNWSCSASKCCLTCSAYHLDHKQSWYQNKYLLRNWIEQMEITGLQTILTNIVKNLTSKKW